MVRVSFIHPDLGIGGAERAIVDAAVALISKGHTVKIFTAHHDLSHCFDETRDGRVSVTAVGDWLPLSLGGYFKALFAYIRMIYVAMYLCFFSGVNSDVIFCDQISACIPFLKLKSRAKILFYCHFPDMLLTQRKNILKKVYRAPLDWLEEKTTGMADLILVNSNFTAGVFKETFKSLQSWEPQVLYPTPYMVKSTAIESGDDSFIPANTKTLFVSINRYERKKNLPLAIYALDKLRSKRGGSLEGVHLIMAGGYDERVDENRLHYLELEAFVDKLKLADHVTFLRSISTKVKDVLLSRCSALVYTPDREHFGIVPIEAMFCSKPVIAVNSGGPKESVINGETGFLCNKTPEDFAEAMGKFVEDPDLVVKMGAAGRERWASNFSFDVFANKLDDFVKQLCR